MTMIRLYVLTACLSLASMTLPAQENDSPYAAFGDTTRTLDCRHADYARFDVPAILDDGTSATLVFDFPRGIAELKDEAGCVLSTDSLPEHLRAIFLSADPKATDYPHVSAYAYCMGNPINIIDPWGLDNVFLNNQGRVVRVVPNGSNMITVIHPNGVAHALSDYDISSVWGLGLNNGQNRQIVANVAGYYGRQVGVSGIVVTDHSMNSLASYDRGSCEILIGPYQNGHVNTQLNDKYNLMNILLHEEFHKVAVKESKVSAFVNHAGIVLQTMKHKSFRQGTKEYRNGQVGQFSQMVMNAYYNKKGDKESALMLLKQFNSSGLGYQLDFDINKRIVFVNGEYYVKYKQGNPNTGNLE